MKDMSAASFQGEVDRLSKDDTRFKAFMKRRMEDSSGGGSDQCDDMCKRFQLCNMSFGNLAEFLQCVYSGYQAMVAKVAGPAVEEGLSVRSKAVDGPGGRDGSAHAFKNSVKVASDLYN
jgi:hypothetical protein